MVNSNIDAGRKSGVSEARSLFLECRIVFLDSENEGVGSDRSDRRFKNMVFARGQSSFNDFVIIWV